MIRVAIVEDRAEFRDVWTDILQNTEGYVFVGAFKNSASAIEGLPKTNADVVMMDIQLNTLNEDETGINVILAIRDQCPQTQFMMFTVWDDDESIFESMKAGATGYMLKKTPPQKVLDGLKDLHEGGSPMSPAIARRVMQSFHQKKENYQLTDMEEQVLVMLDKGHFYKEIGEKMDITINMVKQYCHSIYKKLNAANRQEAANLYRGRKKNAD